ncbi:MAG: adenosine deaminase [Balneolaceae bacterium]|nr:adenosine deaminase [Balneolaceae bacterium]MCH8549058.1 adenosine deaminase [Balneolaceae bacterium]
MDFSGLPKTELHLHLDCSLTYNFVSAYRPEITKEKFVQEYVAPPKCLNLADYLTRSEKSIELMQTGEQLERSVSELFQLLSQDQVIYAEIRFAPLEHIRNGLSSEEVVTIVTDQAKKSSLVFGIEFGFILCTLRHYNREQSMETVKLVKKHQDRGVVGFDIAADEAGFGIDEHISAFKYAAKHGLNSTAHAGEALGADSVEEVLDHFLVSRIGHGVRSVENPQLVERLKREDIHLEICPTSNIQTNVFESIGDHTIDRLFEEGVSISVNTDSRTITPVTLTEEYELLHKEFGWGKDHFKKSNLEAVKHSFAPKTTKERLKQIIESGWV